MSLTERPIGEAISLNLQPVEVTIGSTYRIAGIYSFGRGFIRRPTIDGSETAYPRLYKISKDQLVMSKLGAWEGAFAMVPDEFDGAYVSPEYPSFDVNTAVAAPSYIAHLVRWPTFWDRVTPRGSMARRKRITPAILAGIKVPLPDLHEQHRIAANLDAAMSKLQRVEELRMKSEHCRTALRESFFNTGQENPPVRIGDILTLERIPIAIDPERKYTQIGIRSFGNGIFHRDRVPGSELSKLKYFEIKPERLVVSNIMAWEGAIATSSEGDRECIGSHRFLSFKPSKEVDIRYLNNLFQSKQGRELIRSTSTGTVLRNQTLSIKDFENLIVPLPSIVRQREIASILSKIDRTHAMTQNQAKFSSSYRVSLLNTAFSGQL